MDLGIVFQKVNFISPLNFSTVLHILLTVLYTIPKLEISVILSRLIQECTPNNLDILIILCGNMILWEFDLHSSF